ncbi:hypothetical protein KsCSTR_19120 [Candidatus Kuenenia stuttgartiensis]|uniref:Uncharacterized protein n=1 Tax=Kuenenia stuttgartiensis TaxID=174633 RepID=Q1Q2F3_KUEST|nr:hypothetical protein KsCSTR_19120 [Candidatus Kuenenia stuttgartiensis]CAJ74196.1 unknown protein [Candidatus Kuenenia stuttgartiensis]
MLLNPLYREGPGRGVICPVPKLQPENEHFYIFKNQTITVYLIYIINTFFHDMLF